LKDWWTHFQNANIGIATGKLSGFIVLDIDPRHGGEDSLEQLEQQYGKLPDTVIARTRGGGKHILFTHPGGNIKNSASNLGPGLDIRGDGGYIVVPNSLHASGNSYEWVTEEMELAQLPQWLLEKLSGKPQFAQSGSPIIAQAPQVD